MTDITIHMRKNDGLENCKKKKKKNVFFSFGFSHPGGSVSLTGVQELGSISGRLPDDPGGFTCMYITMLLTCICGWVPLKVDMGPLSSDVKEVPLALGQELLRLTLRKVIVCCHPWSTY